MKKEQKQYICPNCGLKGLKKRVYKNKKSKLTENQRTIKQAIKAGAFKDCKGVLEFTETKEGINYYFHWFDNKIFGKNPFELVSSLNQCCLTDLPLLMHLKGLMTKDNKHLKECIKWHEKNDKNCEAYKFYKTEIKKKNDTL